MSMATAGGMGSKITAWARESTGGLRLCRQFVLARQSRILGKEAGFRPHPTGAMPRTPFDSTHKKEGGLGHRPKRGSGR